MGDKIELLSEQLIDDHLDLALEALASCAKLRSQIGWHYILDFVWILTELDVSPGSTVLDAGAGMGLMQFLLADRGYNVISADMTIREGLPTCGLPYRFDQMGTGREIRHEYLEHHGTARRTSFRGMLRGQLGAILDTSLREIPSKVVEMVTRRTAKGPSSNRPDTGASGEEMPTIVLYRCDLENMEELADDSVDAVVSVSALEHNRPERVKSVVSEIERVMRPGGTFLNTVSACASGRTHHEPSHSWLLDEKGLIEVYGLRCPSSNFSQYENIFRSLKDSRYLRRWLDSSYYQGGKNGMPWGVWAPDYQPVGVRREM